MPKDPAKAQRTLMKFVKLWEILARAHPSVVAFQNDLAAAYASLAIWQTAAGDNDASHGLAKAGIDSYHKAIEIWERLSQSYPEVPEHRENLVMALHELAQRLGRQAEAQELVVRELALTEQLFAQYPNVPHYRVRLASAWKYRGDFLQSVGKKRQAGEAFRRQFEVAKALFKEFPTVANYAVLTATGARDFLDCSNGSGMDAAKWSRRELAPILTNITALARNLPGDRGSRADVAAAFYHLGVAWGDAGDRAAADSAFRQAILLYRRLVQEAPNAPRYFLGQSLRYVAFSLGPGSEHRGDVERAFREAIDAFQGVTVHEPKNIKGWHLLADTHRRLAWVLVDANRPDEVEQEFRRAIDVHETTLEKLHVEPLNEEEWAASYLDLVRFLESKGQSQAAEEVFRRLISRIEAFRSAFPERAAVRRAWIAHAHFELANSIRDKRIDDAQSHYRQSLTDYDALIVASRTNPEYRLQRARSQKELAWTLRWRAGRLADADPEFRKALALFEELADEFPSNDTYRTEVGHTLWDVASIAVDSGRREEAEKQHRRALAIFEKLAVDFPQNLYYRWEQCFSDWNIAGLMRRLGRLKDAEKAYRDAVDVCEKVLAQAPDDAGFRDRLASSHNGLADVLRAENRLDEAEKQIREAAATWQKLVATLPANPDYRAHLAAAQSDLGDARARFGHWDEALAAIDKAAELDPANHWYPFRAAPLHLRAGDVAGYRRICRAMLERFHGTDVREIADRTAKTCLLAPDAVPDFNRVEKLADQAVTGSNDRWFLFVKGLAEYRAGRQAEAVKWIERMGPDARGDQIDASGFAVRAMAQHRLGQNEQARAALHSGQVIVAGKMPDPSDGQPFDGPWQDWLHSQILLREAEALVNAKPDVDYKSESKRRAPTSAAVNLQPARKP
jgi:tetratricopeptide (TPR) repeat protein